MIGLVFRFSNHCVDRLSGPIPAVEPVTSANMSDCCRSMMVLLAATRYVPVLLLMTQLREESRKRRRPSGPDHYCEDNCKNSIREWA